jgi:hypothetical protein
VLVRSLSGENNLTSPLSRSGRQKGSPSRASNSTENDDAEEDDAPCSGDDGSGEGAAEGASGEAETLQAANPFEKLPFELFCEVSYV